MTSEHAAADLRIAVRLAGANRFYTRRVLQRCQRGEITLSDAARLLIASVSGGETVDVPRWVPEPLE